MAFSACYSNRHANRQQILQYQSKSSMRMHWNITARPRRPPSPTDRLSLVLASRYTFRAFATLTILCTMARLMATRTESSAFSQCFDPMLAENIDCRSFRALPLRRNDDEHLFYPRVVIYSHDQSENVDGENILGGRKLPKRYVSDLSNAKARKRIAKNDNLELDDVEVADCKLRYIWQKNFFPTCNLVHEFDGTSPWASYANRQQKKYRVLGRGFWRDVWIVNFEQGDGDKKGIFKTMRYDHEYTPRNFDRMKRDSTAMERLTKSPFVIDIYSFCGTSSLSEFGEGGDIPNAIWAQKDDVQLSQIDKLRIATQAAIGLSTVHNVDKEGEASIAHTDISPAQYINVNGIYKLNDFNRARFIAYAGDQICPFLVGSNPGKNRSPEEYQYKALTEKVDVYSLGNIFFMLLQGDWPFEGVSNEEARELVMNGTRPTIYYDLWYSDDPINMVLKEAMIMSHEHDPAERASARQVEAFLKDKMRELDPGRLELWGLS